MLHVVRISEIPGIEPLGGLAETSILDKAANADHTWRNHGEGMRQFCTVPIDCRSDYLRFAAGRQSGQAYQHNAMRIKTLTKDHLSKIFVGGQQQSSLSVGRGEDNIVGNSWFHLGNVPYEMTVLPKALNDLTINTFVSQEIHATASAMG